MTCAADGLVNFSFQQLKPSISGYIQDKVSAKFCSHIMRELVFKLCAIDAMTEEKEKNKDGNSNKQHQSKKMKSNI